MDLYDSLLLVGLGILFCICAMLLTVIFWYLAYALYNLTRKKEYYETSSQAINDIAKYLSEHQKKAFQLYDFGSGDGKVLFRLHEIFPDGQFIGYELDRIRIFVTQFRCLFLKQFSHRLTFLRRDFLKVDMSKIYTVFVYLPRNDLTELSKKFIADLPIGSIVITYRIEFPDWVPTHVIHTDVYDNTSFHDIFIYSKTAKGFVG